MASSVTEEKTYYLRLVALIIDIAPKAVRAYFNSVFPPVNLATELKKNKKKLKHLRYSSKVLTSAQWVTLFPTGSANVSSNDFDLTLMVCLLRNLSGVTPPALGFDCLPSSTDIGVADDLARIKYFRNKIAHSDDGSLTNADFLTAWDNVSQAVERLGGLTYHQDCINLKDANLDSACYRDILLNISHSQDEKLQKLTDKIENALMVTEETKHALEDPVPAARRGIFKEEIDSWEEMDKKFVETHSSKQLLNIMKLDDTVIITGNPGMGKSFLMKHIALQMKSDGYEILPITDPKDILTYTLPNRKTLYVIDDICGKYNVVQNLIEVWEYNSSEIKKCIGKSKCKILSNCRLQVYQSKQFQSLKILSQKQFNILSLEYSLTTEEKRRIAMKYLQTDFAKKLPADIINQYDCFPLLCTLLPNKDEEKAMLFLKRPYEIFSKELELLYNKADRLMYCALALVVVFNNSLCESMLLETVDKNTTEVFEEIFEACGESKSSSRQRVKENLDSLNSSYVLKHVKTYSFIHPKIYEMAAYYFAKKSLLLNCMLKHCSAAYLCERFIFQSIADANHEFQIELPSYLEITFFDKLMKSANDENILDIFGCKLMNYVEYRTKLISYMKTMDNVLKAKLLRLSRNGLTLFHLMCKLGHTDVIRFCMDEKIELNSYQDIGLTPLHTACKYEKKDVIDMLLKFGVNTNKYKSAGYTPLYDACKTGKTNAVKKLLMHGADPSLCSDKRLIPLLIATKKGHTGIVHLLLRYKADINQQDANGVSALHLASMTDNVDLLQFLIRVGAYVDIKTNNEETPLYFACEKEYAGIITLLLTDNANVFNISARTGLSPLSVLLTNGKQELANDILNNIPNKMLLNSALENASENNDVKLVDALLRSNIDANVTLPSGNTALHVATKNGHFTLVKLLLYHGANLNCQTQEGATPIQLSCLGEHEEIVSLLVSEGAKVNVSNTNLCVLPPLHISCLLENKDMASILVNGNADLNEIRMLNVQTMSELRQKNYIHSLFSSNDMEIKGLVTPIEIVCMARDSKVLCVLLEKGADSNMKTDLYGTHPLLIACFYKESDMIDMLLHHRSNVNVYGNIDNLCLTYIMCHGDEDIIELIAYRRNEKTSSAVTPLHIACVNGHVSTVSSVLRFGARTDIATLLSPFVIYTLKQEIRTDLKCSAVNKYLKKYNEIENILPIHLCCFGGNPHIVELVINSMTVMTENLTLRVNALQIACLHGKFYKHRFGIETQYYTLDPLQIACLGRHWDICKLLLDKGYNAFLAFDVSEFLISCFTDTKSSFATENNITIYKTSVIEFAYENKAHDLFKHILNATQRFEKSMDCVVHKLFTLACENNEVELANLIFSTFINIDDGQPSSLLHVACEHNMIEIVDFILSATKKIEQRNEKFETALHITSMSGSKDLIQLLLKRGFSPFASTLAGENSFHLACKHNQVDSCSLLLKYADDPIYSIYTDTVHCTNIYTSEKKTTTFFAYINKNETLLSILLDSGADINLPVGEEKETLLFLACKEGRADYVEFFLERSADVNLANCEGETPLLVSCATGHDPITRQLLKANASVNVQANNGCCPLYYAHNDNFEITELLLQKKADPNCLLYDGAESLLIKAVKSGSHKTVELLLTYGSNVYYSVTPGQPALYFAFEAEDSKMMKCLLRFNADQHVCCHERANYLYLACERGMVDIVELILFHDRNIDPNVDYADGKTSLYACYNSMNHTDSTAAVARYKKIGRLLIRFGADINKETKNNETPFHQLCINRAYDEIDYVLEKCNIKQEYILSEMLLARNQGNITLLNSLIAHYRQPIQNEHFADIWFDVVEKNQVEIINLLIEKGIDTNITNNIHKHCALHIASAKGNINVVQSILRQDDTILNMKSISGYTPLHVACLNGHVEICEILINNGVNITEKTNTDKSLLQLAFYQPNIEVVSFLLRSNRSEILKQFQDEIVKFKVLYDQSNEAKKLFRQLITISNTNFNVDDTDTCIHFACRNEDTDLIQQLITKKYDLNCVNEYGLTPLMISICKGNVRNVELLLSADVSVIKNTLILNKGVEECLGTFIPRMANATPLHISCLKRYSEIVKHLVVRNAQCDSLMQVYYSLPAHTNDCEKLSPLFISVIKRDFETVQLLLQSISDSGILTSNSVFISSLFNNGTFVENDFFLDYRTDLTPFQAACILGYNDIVDELIKYYPDINQKFKITPITLSFCANTCELMHQFLSSYGYDNKDFEIEVTPLIFSVLVGNFKLLKTLLSNYANHEFEASFCLLHVVSLNEDILYLLVSDYLEPQEFLLLKCTLNALSIACLKDDAKMCQLLLSKYADPLYATQLTAMHVICFRGYDSHLTCVIKLRLQVGRYFRIQCSHIIACSNCDETDEDFILSSPGFNDVLDISNVELACFYDDVDFLINIFQIFPKKSYNSVMNVTPLFLSCMFENDEQFKIGMFMSDTELQSNVPYQVVIARLCTTRLDISDIIVHPLQPLTPRDNIQISNLSLLLKKYCLCICSGDDEEKALTLKLVIKVAMGKVIPDPVEGYEVNLLMLLFLDLKEDNEIMSTVSNLLQNIDVGKKVFQLNFTYLLLLKNVSLELMPVSAYSELSQEPLSFTAVEAFYLIQGRIPDSFFLSTEARYQKLKIDPIIIACLHGNLTNVEWILQRKADINQTNELSLLHLTSFPNYEFGNKLIQRTSFQTSVANVNALHVAILAGNVGMTRILLENGCCVNTSAYLTPFHIPVIQKKMPDNSDISYDNIGLLAPFPDTVIAEEKMNSILVSVEMKPIHIACFYTNNIDFVRLLFGRHNCNLESAAKLSTLALYFINQDDEYETEINHNTLEAVSELTPLNIACLLDNTHLVEYLLTKQIEADSIGYIFPLHMNISHCSDIAELITIQSEFIVTSLHIALLNNNEDIVGLLIEYGANVDMSISLIIELNIGNMFISTHSSLKAIHLACLIGNSSIFGMILSKTTFMDEKCEVSLWHLCYLEAIGGVKMYESFDREIELHLNAMHIFCITGDCARVEMLLNAEANCNLAAEIPLVYTKVKSTVRLYKFPLHLAAERGNLEICTLLLKHNADSEVRTNIIGFKPWHLALYHGHVDVLKHLLTVRTTIRKSLFMFTLFLFILRVRYGNIMPQLIVKLRNVIPLLSFYRYLMNVFGFSLIP